jgi:hypothetical protein
MDPLASDNLTAIKGQLRVRDLLSDFAADCPEMDERSPRSLLEPYVWTGIAKTSAVEPLREKRVKIHWDWE